MKNTLRLRFWIETALASITGLLFLATLIKHDWIELVFGFDPDNYTGHFELILVGVLLVVTIVFIALAGIEWRRARVAIS